MFLSDAHYTLAQELGDGMANPTKAEFTSRIVTVSTKGAKGEREDRSGSILQQCLGGIGMDSVDIDIISDDRLLIQQKVIQYSDLTPVSLLVFNGGTGPTPDDVTPEAIEPLLERRYDGIANLIMLEGRKSVATAPLSRLVIGQRGRTVIIALPGSSGAVTDAFSTLEPMLSHLLHLAAGERDGH